MFESKRSDLEPPLWEERIILVSALDEEEAEEKAKKNAIKYESEFMVSDTVEVKWKFHKVESVFFIDEKLNDGCELFSRFLKASEAKSILAPFDE